MLGVLVEDKECGEEIWLGVRAQDGGYGEGKRLRVIGGDFDRCGLIDDEQAQDWP